MDPAEHFTVRQIFVQPDNLTQLRGDVGDSVVHASQVNFLVTGHTSHIGLTHTGQCYLKKCLRCWNFFQNRVFDVDCLQHEVVGEGEEEGEQDAGEGKSQGGAQKPQQNHF